MILSISPSLYIYSNGAHNNAKRQLAEPWFGGFCSNEKRDKKLEIFGHTGDCVIAAICDEDGVLFCRSFSCVDMCSPQGARPPDQCFCDTRSVKSDKVVVWIHSRMIRKPVLVYSKIGIAST
jgi:hypothetical protein